MPRLPPSVLANILDSLEDGHSWPALQYVTREEDFLQCSYVSKDWRPIAQSLLFKHLRIPATKDLQHLLSFLKKTPRISAYIQTLRVSRDEHGRKTQHNIQPHILYEVLRLLPNVRELDLFRVFLLGWKNGVAFPTRQIKLQVLTLSDLLIAFQRGHRFEKPFDFLKLFEADTMRIYNGEVPYRSPSLEPWYTLPVVSGNTLPAVRELMIFGESLFIGLNDEKGGLDRSRLSTLRLEPTTGEQVFMYGRFLQRYAENIRHLSLLAGRLQHLGDSSPTGIWQYTNVEACAQLESLQFHWVYGPMFPSTHSQARDVYFRNAYRAVLSSAPLGLRQLSLVVSFEIGIQQAFPELFADIAPHLVRVIEHAAARFAGLQRITVEISDRLELEQGADIVRGLLPADLMDSEPELLRFKAKHEFCF